MRISIVTPSYNQVEFIEETIQSVINQNYDDVEHIVIDGGSTDGTVSILKKYSHLKWTSQKDLGQSNALNKGFQKVTGDIVAWLNSDDYYENNVFGNIMQYFEMNSDCMFLYGDITFVDRKRRLLGLISGDTMNYENLVKCPDIVRQPSCFWRRKIMQELGGIDENLQLVMDFDYFLRITKKYPIHYINRNLSYYRYYVENKSLSMVKQQIIEIYKVYKKNNISLDPSIVKFLIAKYLHSLGLHKNILRQFIQRNLFRE